MLRDIVGYEGIYTISPQGEIRGTYRKTPMAGWVGKIGYRMVSLWKNGQGTKRTVHTLLAECFIPNPDHLPEVNHIDVNKANNSLANLEYVSGSDNIRHAFASGLARYSALIDYAKVPALLQEAISGTTLRDIAEREGLQETGTLRKLLRREAVRTGVLSSFLAGSVAARKSIVTERSHVILQIDVSGNVVNEFVSMNAAARFFSCNPAAIHKAVTKQRPYKDFIWERKDA